MHGSAAEDVDHVDLRGTRVLVTAEGPTLLAIIVVNVEDGEVVGVQVVRSGNVLAGLGNPARTPVVPVRVHRVQVVTQTRFEAAIVPGRVHVGLVGASQSKGRGSSAADNRSLGEHIDECNVKQGR